MKMSDIINKIQNIDSYETLCIEQIINNDLYSINFSEELFNINTRILCHNRKIVISIFELSILEKVTNFLHESNLIIPKEYNKNEYLEIDLSPIIRDLNYEETINMLLNFYEQINYYSKSSTKRNIDIK